MDRKLPQQRILGTMFEIDVMKEELREVKNPENKIRFRQMSVVKDGAFTFNYHLEQRNITDMSRLGDVGTILVRIPQMDLLDPVGMAEKYIGMSAEINPHMLIDKKFLANRLRGRQPVLDIEGQLFFVDLRWGFLRPKDDLASLGISIAEIEDRQYNDGEMCVFDYDPRTYQVVDLHVEDLLTYPENLLRVVIPDIKHLDPVGYARKSGRNLHEVLAEVPIKHHHEGKIVPWKKTECKVFIERNRAKSKEVKDNISQKSTKGRGRKL